MEPGGAEATRAALIRAAEQMMGRHGIAGADLGEIQLAAGQRNKSAVHYYFDDRAGLVMAIGVKHWSVINAERHKMIDQLEEGGPVSVRELVQALVLPLARELEDESGRDYLMILAEAGPRIGTAGMFRPTREREELDSVERPNGWLVEHLNGSRAARKLRITQAILVIPVLLADIARGVDRGTLTVAEAGRRVRTVLAFIGGALRVSHPAF